MQRLCRSVDAGVGLPWRRGRSVVEERWLKQKKMVKKEEIFIFKNLLTF
jgi:hypothetical protein